MLADAEKILVPIDGSEEARKAFVRAIGIAKRIDAQIEVVSIINDASFENQTSSRSDEILTVLQTSRIRLLEKYAEVADTKYNFKNVKTFTVIGKPSYQIIRLLREDPAYGLVVLGATGKNAVERTLLGSVSQQVLREATVPVLIVRD